MNNLLLHGGHVHGGNDGHMRWGPFAIVHHRTTPCSFGGGMCYQCAHRRDKGDKLQLPHLGPCGMGSANVQHQILPSNLHLASMALMVPELQSWHCRKGLHTIIRAQSNHWCMHLPRE